MHRYHQILTPVIFGHRGASKYAPENTHAAFELAFSQGADGIELDTMLSRDGVPVVIHDRKVDRTTNGHGYVDKLTIDELENLDAGCWFSKEYKGEKIPLLRDVLEKFGKNHLINIELKNFHSPNDNLAVAVIRMIEEIQYLDTIILSSFLLSNICLIRKLAPNITVAFLYSKSYLSGLEKTGIFKNLSPDFIHPEKNLVNQKLIIKEHEQGRRINTWTIDDVSQAMELIKAGIDGLITNDPLSLVNIKKSLSF